MFDILELLPNLIAQSGSGSGVSIDVSKAAAESADKPGEVDFNLGEMWETIDGMLDGFVSRLPAIIVAIIVFTVFYFVGQLVRTLAKKYTAGSDSANLGKVIGRLSQWVILFIGLMISVAIIAPSVQPSDLLAGLGVGGVAIGFAFRDILQNFLSGVLILFREPFKVGDQIQSGEFEGTVRAIETRATVIKTDL